MSTHTLTRASFGALCSLALILGSACSSGTSHQAADHAAPATTPTTDAAAPLPGTSAVLVVNGMSCPKCANNIHVSLNEVPGVADSKVDLGAGKVTVQFDPLNKANPSRAALAKVIADSGFTLVDVQSN